MTLPSRSRGVTVVLIMTIIVMIMNITADTISWYGRAWPQAASKALPELAHPLKVSLTGHTLRGQLGCHIPGVNVHNNESTQGFALQLAQLPPHLVHHLFAYSKMVSKQPLLGSAKRYDACCVQNVGVQAQLTTHSAV